MRNRSPIPVEIGQRVFTAADQLAFAAASGDNNPMHVDAVAARRLLSGRQVVHGVHTLLLALELWFKDSNAAAGHVACNFANPVNVGDRVVFSQTEGDTGQTTVTASVDGLVCTEIVIGSATVSPAPRRADKTRIRHIAPLATPLDENPGSQLGTLIRLDDGATPLDSAFPQVAARLGSRRLAALAQLSYFVGMVCPGQHSVFSSLHFSPTDAAAAVEFEVHKYDPRFRLFIVGFQGCIQGELRAFLRPPPQPQPSTIEVSAHVAQGEFKGTRSLVIGGSRGLGEITAKLLGAGGGDVVISYATGSDDADAVAADIQAHGAGRCEAVHLDLKGDFLRPEVLDATRLDAVYFFPTPRIFNKRTELFDRAAFDEFVDFYLHRFYQLCRLLNQTERLTPIKVYLPSTVFITERPKGMTEYAMAKAAAEVLAEDLNRSMKNVQIIHSRLPRLATDQTSSIMKMSVASNVEALLPVVRAVSGQISSAISSL